MLRLAESGNTVIVIEHNLDVIKTADYIIDLGPEGGDKGGTVIATGTPEKVADNPNSYTGVYIKKMLDKQKRGWVMNDHKGFFAMMARMKYIERWALMRNSVSENICEHSLEVAMLAHGLGIIGRKRFGKDLSPERLAM